VGQALIDTVIIAPGFCLGAFLFEYFFPNLPEILLFSGNDKEWHAKDMLMLDDIINR
jgi:hypothetical protein